MYKLTNKILLGVLGVLFVHSMALGIDAEFKNSLMRIDLNKSADDAYTINLYTKNKFQEPVKVIKKSDLNYYILLPETKNESTRVSNSGNEIRSISTNVYPYAGQDVKNGYVKINIDTTKPLNFKVNVKNIDAITKTPAQPDTLAEAKAAPIKEKQEVSVEKKNSVSSNSKNPQPKEQPSLNKQPQPLKKKPAPVLKENSVKNPPLKIEEAVKQEVERVKEEKLQNDPNSAFDDVLEEDSQLQDPLEVLEEESSTDEIQNYIEPEEQGIFEHAFDMVFIKNKIRNKLAQYGITLKEFAFMAVAFVLSFFFMLALLTKKSPQARLKSKADLIEKDTTPKFKAPKEPEVKNDGQYFVFDKNVKQTGFCDPATSAIKRNYELSSYEPELKNKYSRNISPVSKKFESEYDIIQKILKEDTFIDLPSPVSNQQVKTLPKAALPQKEACQNVSTPIKQEEVKKEPPKPQEPKKEPKQEQNIQKTKQNTQPVVLSSVEIAPERGFMCVSYNDNISLMGYIFDDVFALYNFKTPKLENYDIKFRLSEKDDKLARFIVKIANTKMLIKVTKTQMDMEVLL